jgi:hypothetical protein
MHTHRYEIIVHLFFAGRPWDNPSWQTDVQALFLFACLWVSVSQPRQIDLQALIFSFAHGLVASRIDGENNRSYCCETASGNIFVAAAPCR